MLIECFQPKRKFLFASFLMAALVFPALSSGQESSTKSIMNQSILAGNFKEAFQVSEKEAENGDKEAQFNLALFYYHGVGVPQNFEYALRWANLSALQGFKKAFAARPPIMEKLQPETILAAMTWVRQRLTKAAEEGDNIALVMLSNSFATEFGFGDPKESYYWASLAVATGRTEAKRRRDALVKELKATDFKEVQDRSVEWFSKFRKSAS
jgi:TPR repeat protein